MNKQIEFLEWKKLWDDLRNRVAGCRSCNDLLHFRRMEMFPGERKQCWEKFCAAAGHDSWLQDLKRLQDELA
jgi:hypothetical protein